MSRPQKATSFALRLPLSMRQKANEMASAEGVSLNQFITIAIAEKIVRSDQCDRQTRVQSAGG